MHHHIKEYHCTHLNLVSLYLSQLVRNDSLPIRDQKAHSQVDAIHCIDTSIVIIKWTLTLQVFYVRDNNDIDHRMHRAYIPMFHPSIYR